MIASIITIVLLAILVIILLLVVLVLLEAFRRVSSELTEVRIAEYWKKKIAEESNQFQSIQNSKISQKNTKN